jgi:hypothetical protein
LQELLTETNLHNGKPSENCQKMSRKNFITEVHKKSDSGLFHPKKGFFNFMYEKCETFLEFAVV